MNQLLSVRPSVIDTIVPGTGILRDILSILGFACFTALCSLLSFWLGPVPITGQTLGVLLSGAVLGSRRGALSQASYLVIGATGIPFWFALGGPIGIARLIGPTAGYLYGFIAMAFIVGWLSERGWYRKIYLSIPAMLAGEIALYFFGLNWLSMYVPSEKLLQAGLYPFIAGDLLKVMVAGSFLPLCCCAVNRAK